MSDPHENTPLVSVIIVNYNTRAQLARCLDSLRAACEAVAMEILVADNGSADGSPAMVATEYPEARLIPLQENLGFARANNLAARLAQGRYLLLLNSDATVKPGTVPGLVAFLEANPEAGIAAPRLRNPDGSYQPSVRTFPCPLNLFLEATALDRLVRRTAHGGFAGDATRPVEYASGAALMIRRRLWQALGGFDESFFFYGEDADLCYRALAEGAQTWFVHTVEVVHEGGASSSSLGPHAAVEGYRAYLLFIRKHAGAGAVVWARLWVLLGAGLRVLACALPAAFAPPWRGRLRTHVAVLRLTVARHPYPIGRFGWPEDDAP